MKAKTARVEGKTSASISSAGLQIAVSVNLLMSLVLFVFARKFFLCTALTFLLCRVFPSHSCVWKISTLFCDGVFPSLIEQLL